MHDPHASAPETAAISADPVPQTATGCPKCGGHVTHTGEFRAAGGFWSSLFDYSNKRFRYVSCAHCGYTEFYHASISGAAKFLDFMARS